LFCIIKGRKISPLRQIEKDRDENQRKGEEGERKEEEKNDD
jgi:hypothetical protein